MHFLIHLNCICHHKLFTGSCFGWSGLNLPSFLIFKTSHNESTLVCLDIFKWMSVKTFGIFCVFSQGRRWLSASLSCCLWLFSYWSSWSWSPPHPVPCLSSGSTCSSPWCSSSPPSSSPSSSSTPTTALPAPTQCQTGSARWVEILWL